MYGKNVVRKFDPSTGEVFRIQEIYFTIQGEGPFAGIPAVFIRLAGCNLRCHFCDTDFESNYDKDPWDLNLIRTWITTLNMREGGGRKTNLVVLTGGEPMRQRIAPLIDLICGELGLHAQIETSGTLWFPADSIPEHGIQTDLGLPQPKRYSFVVSPKTGEVNPAFNEVTLAWKYVVEEGGVAMNGGEGDGLPSLSTQIPGRKCILARPPKRTLAQSIFIQPMDVPDRVQYLRNLDVAIGICLSYGYRLSLQQHKVINLP
jgi:organic radical activating enzyme